MVVEGKQLCGVRKMSLILGVRVEYRLEKECLGWMMCRGR